MNRLERAPTPKAALHLSRLSMSTFLFLLITGLLLFWGHALTLGLLITYVSLQSFPLIFLLDALLWIIVAQTQTLLQLRFNHDQRLILGNLVGILIILVGKLEGDSEAGQAYVLFFLANRVFINTFRHYTLTCLAPAYTANHRRQQLARLMLSSRAIVAILGVILLPVAFFVSQETLINGWLLSAALTTLPLAWLGDIALSSGSRVRLSTHTLPPQETAPTLQLWEMIQPGMRRWLTTSALSIAILSTLILYQTTWVVAHRFSEITSFIAFFVLVGVVTIAITLTLEHWILARFLRRHNAGTLIRIYPSLLSIALVSILAVPALLTAAWGEATRRPLRKIIYDPIERLVYHALPAGEGFRARRLIYTIIEPLGQATAALTLMTTVTIWEQIDHLFLIPGLIISGLLLLAVRRVGVAYTKALSISLSTGPYHVLRQTAVEWEWGEQAPIYRMIERLRAYPPDETNRLLLAEVVAHSKFEDGYDTLRQIYLDSPTSLQIELLPLIINSWPDKCTQSESRELIFAALENEDSTLRGQALRLIAAYPQLDPEYQLARFLIDPEPDIVVIAASILLHHPNPRISQSARAQLGWLAKDNRVSIRVAAVQALINNSLNVFGERIKPLNITAYLQDTATRVREAALAAATTEQLIEATLDASAKVRTTAALYLRERRFRGAYRSLLATFHQLEHNLQTAETVQIRANLHYWRLLAALTISNRRAGRKRMSLALQRGFEQLTLLDTIILILREQRQAVLLPLIQQLQHDRADLLEAMLHYLSILMGKRRIQGIVWALQHEQNTAAAIQDLHRVISHQYAHQLYRALRNEGLPPSSQQSLLPNVVYTMLLNQDDDWHSLLTLYILEKLPTRQQGIDETTRERILDTSANSQYDIIREAARLIRRSLESSIEDSDPGALARLEDKVEGVIMLSTLERMLFLRNVSFFRNLSLDQLRVLARNCEELTAAENQRIIKQDDVGDGLFVIVEGQVRIERHTPDGKTTLLGHIYASEVFGEISLLDGGLRTADIVADTPVLLLSIHRDALHAALEDDPTIALTMLHTMAQRLRRTTELVDQKTVD